MEKGKAIRLLIIVVCAYLIVTNISGMVDLLKSGDKLTRRENDLAQLTKEQQNLKIREKKAGSINYLEEMAYQKLGLSRPGEEVVIIPQELLADKTPVEVKDNTPNWKKWARLFF